MTSLKNYHIINTVIKHSLYLNTIYAVGTQISRIIDRSVIILSYAIAIYKIVRLLVFFTSAMRNPLFSNILINSCLP